MRAFTEVRDRMQLRLADLRIGAADRGAGGHAQAARIPELRLRGGDRFVRRGQLRGRARRRGDRIVQLLGRNRTGIDRLQLLVALQLPVGIGGIGLRRAEIGPGHLHLGRIDRELSVRFGQLGYRLGAGGRGLIDAAFDSPPDRSREGAGRHGPPGCRRPGLRATRPATCGADPVPTTTCDVGVIRFSCVREWRQSRTPPMTTTRKSRNKGPTMTARRRYQGSLAILPRLLRGVLRRLPFRVRRGRRLIPARGARFAGRMPVRLIRLIGRFVAHKSG